MFNVVVDRRILLESDYEALHNRFKIIDGRLLKIDSGVEVGSLNNAGYLETSIKIDNTMVRSYIHRIIFLMENNYLPEQVDHIDRNRSNNKIENLREASASQNCFNIGLQVNNNSGVTGVYFDNERCKWIATLKKNRKKVLFKRFDTMKEAILARRNAEKEYCDGFK